MRITTVRIIVQTLVLALFLTFVSVTSFAWLDGAPAMRFWLSKFLEIDPLVAISTAITTHTLYKGLAWALLVLIPTLFLGRIFCNWICPFGILHHFVGWLGNQRNVKQRIESNRYRPIYGLKYLILVAMLVAALFGTLQIGLLDPICLLYRSFSTAILPALNLPEPMARVFGDPKMHQFGWVIGFMVAILLGMNLLIPRFFCRVLCPLGALLGVLSRFSLWRIERDPHNCSGCGQCVKNCEGACDPDSKLRKSECFVCFNCIEDCPHGSMRFAFMPSREREVTSPDLPRRRAIYAGAAGLLFYPFARLSGRSTKDFASNAVRPPGSVEEVEFLARCLKCDQCIRVCPTNVLQPATLEAGVEGLWTPVMNFRMGFCQLNCTACGHVCPTGAIQPLTIDEKLGYGAFKQAGPIKVGTAHYDLGRCLPWSKNIPCVVCEEVCPMSPKAIHCEHRQMLIRDGKKQVTSATLTQIMLAECPPAGQAFGEACWFKPGQFKGDQTSRYYLRVVHRDGTTETHRILDNDAEVITIGEQDPATGDLLNGDAFAQLPTRGEFVELNLEIKVPKIDTQQCIGCGLCESECPVVGDKRAVYVTADGETRSQHYLQRERNRSVRLLKNSD